MAVKKPVNKTTKKKPATARKSRARKKPRPETFDFCDGILNDKGEIEKFSQKEKMFVLNYLTDAGFSQAKAARLAGYDAKSENAFRVIGCQLMKKSKIRSAINNALEAITMPKFENLFRVGEIAKNTIFDVLSDDGKSYDSEKAIESGAIHNIHSIEFTERIIDTQKESVDYPDDLDLSDGDRMKEIIESNVIERKTKIKMYSKLDALKVLKDVNFAKKHELTGAGGKDLPITTQANVLILPDNGRNDSPDALAEKAKGQAGTKKGR